MQVLINLGARVNETRVHHYTAAGAAASKGFEGVLRLLRENGCDLSAADNASGPGSGQTPAHMAAVYGREHVLSLLHSWGVPLDSKDSSGQTPEDFAKWADCARCAKWLSDRRLEQQGGRAAATQAATRRERTSMHTIYSACIQLYRSSALSGSLQIWRLSLAHLNATAIHEQNCIRQRQRAVRVIDKWVRAHFNCHLRAVRSSFTTWIQLGHNNIQPHCVPLISGQQLQAIEFQKWQRPDNQNETASSTDVQAAQHHGSLIKATDALLGIAVLAYFFYIACAPFSPSDMALFGFFTMVLAIFCALQILAGSR